MNELLATIDAAEGIVAQAALAYAGRGWSVIPVPFRSKNPGFADWEQMRLTAETVGGYFNGHPENIGVLLGLPSKWLIDIDLDHIRAVELAPIYLPETPAIFGRAGKPRSHWLFYVTAPAATKKFRSKSAGMIVEFRSSGMQTIFPPSEHESGEKIVWENDGAEPAIVDPEELLDRVKQLADAVKRELGEKPARKKEKTQRQKPELTVVVPPEPATQEQRAERCLAAMLRMAITDKRDGSHRLYACACRAVEHDLDDDTALQVIRGHSRQRPFPREWSDDEIIQRVRDAESRCHRGEALAVDKDGTIALGCRDPESGRVVLSPRRTLPTAIAYIREFHDHFDGRTFHSYAGMLLEWRGNRYVEVEPEAVRKRLQVWLHGASRYVRDRQTQTLVLADFESNPGTINAALDSTRAFAHLPATVVCPSWREKGHPPANEFLACRSLLLHLPTMERYEATPAFFSFSALDFDPDPHAPEPHAWNAFLHQLFDDDLESLDLLQEWFGYSLTGDTSLQKMLLIVGPKRSGKGTLARVLTGLVGLANVCGPTTSNLAGQFGLQPLIGKTLAIVSDARFSGEGVATVVERLLCITGEDTLTVERKFKTAVTMKLSTRFLFLTNEFPRLSDASGALAGRFVVLRLTESFYGKEDPKLTTRLLAELPSILNWAIEGWKRLRERGHFRMPQSVQDVVREIEDLSSPVSAFVREECDVGPGHRVDVDELYEEWRRWCEREGRQAISIKQTFGRDLAAAITGVVRRRGTAQRPFYEGIALKGGSR